MKAEESKFLETIHLPQTNFPQRMKSPSTELEIQRWWSQNRIYEKILDQNNQGHFFLHDGPPYANGRIHIGHAVNKILKDILNRYKLLRGEKGIFIPGWDCHGLPIEHKVQELSKESGISRLRSLSKEYALSAVREQMASFQRCGIWALWDDAYLTLQPNYESAQIKIFGELFRKGLIYRKLRPVHWSVSSRSVLAEAEIEYDENHVSQSIYFGMEISSFPPQLACIPALKGGHLLIWTTTPWTIPANKAVAVNPCINYSTISHPDVFGGAPLIVASQCISNLTDLLGTNFSIVAELNGRDLLGIKYRHPLSSEVLEVLSGDSMVSAVSGTGLVHIAPGHGMEDYAIGMKNSLEICSPVDESGRFTEEAGKDLMGLHVLTEGSAKVQEKLTKLNLLWKVVPYKHKYPCDWRTKLPTIFRATQQWFISLRDLKKDVYDEIEKVNWVPEQGKNRIRSMVAARDDWCISRQRVWGVPIPVFYHKKNGSPLINEEIISYVEKLFLEYGSDIWWEREVSELLPPSLRELSNDYEKGFDTMDVWFDSGTSWAAMNPEHSKFPADLYLEGSDQFRGWFQSSLLTSVAVKGKAPFAAVLTHGFVLDGNGRKMSKSLGNVVDPLDLIDGKKPNGGFGSDTLRLWISSLDYTSDICVSVKLIQPYSDSYQKIRSTLRFLLGALNDFRFSEAVPYEDLPEIDKHMLGTVTKVVASVETAYNNFQLGRVHQIVMHFLTVDLSAFYLELGKDRLYIPSQDAFERRSFQTTLQIILQMLLSVIAPILPHLAEELWMHIPSPESEGSAFQNLWPAYRFPASQEEFWSLARQLKRSVNKALDTARKEKIIGASLEADVQLLPQTEDFFEFLKRFSSSPDNCDSLEKLLMVSKVAVGKPASDFSVDDTFSPTFTCGDTPLKIRWRKHPGFKCQRCWFYSESPNLCERCTRILSVAD